MRQVKIQDNKTYGKSSKREAKAVGKREFRNDKCLHQEARNISNKPPHFTPQELKREEEMTSGVSTQRENDKVQSGIK